MDFRLMMSRLFGLLLFILPVPILAAETISICTDANFWYPFTFVQNKSAAGLHVDIIDKALRNLGYQPKFTPLPWNQCLKDTKKGLYDAIATISYKDDRAIFLNFPEGAANDVKSPWRVTQVEYVVITPTTQKNGEKNTYTFTGNIKNIPEPIRIPQGYSIIETLEREGLKVEEGKDSIVNFKKLIEEQTGSIIDIADVAKYLSAEPKFHDKIKIQEQPLVTKSYYLAFNKNGKINNEDAQRIWVEIAKVREDAPVMTKFLKQY